VLAPAILDWLARRRLGRERSRGRRRVVFILLFVALTAFVIFAVERHNRQTRELIQAYEQRDRNHSVSLASSATQSNDPDLSINLALEALKVMRTPEAEEALKKALNRPERTVIYGHTGGVRSAAFSPDGTLIVTAGDDSTARVWREVGGMWIWDTSLDHPDWVSDVEFSPDGKFVVTACKDGIARIWGVGSWEEVTWLDGHQGSITDTALSPDGTLIVTAGEDRTARVWRLVNGRWETLKVLKGHTGPVQAAAFSHDGAYMVTASRDGTARIWETGTWRQVQALDAHQSVLRGAAFSPDGRMLVTAGENNLALVWRKEGGSWHATKTTLQHAESVIHANFSPDGKLLVTTSQDNNARIWDVETEGNPTYLSGHDNDVNDARFSPDGGFIVTSSDDKTARVWKVRVDPAETSGTLDELKEIARSRVQRELTRQERIQYLLRF
ncbi:MAG: WD40 repeat domain-containing protein, partial [Pyrinomonadaceae bacterium]